MEKIIISGFADEISPDLDKQLKVVRELGMDHISLRSADGKGIADYTAEEFAEKLLPRLDEAQVKISSMGSPIGKIPVDSEEDFEKQKKQLEEICKMCKLSGCRYIRMFSFYIPKDKNPDDYKDEVIAKLKEFEEIARKYEVVLLHENEKDIYGDIARRCKVIFDEIPSPYLKAAFDFANFVQCKEDTQECWDMLKEHVAYIHIKDAVYTDNENKFSMTFPNSWIDDNNITVTHYNSQRHIINKTGLSTKQVQALCKGQTVKGFHLYEFKD